MPGLRAGSSLMRVIPLPRAQTRRSAMAICSNSNNRVVRVAGPRSVPTRSLAEPGAETAAPPS